MGTEGTTGAGAADGIVEATLERLRGGGTHVDCPQSYARRVLREGFAAHARALLAPGAPPPPESRTVKFAFRERKALECLLLLLEGPLGQAAPLRLYLALYAAETAHLARHARPVFCDTYIATPAGPVPSMVERVVRGDLGLCADPEAAAAALEWGTGLPAPRRPPNLDLLSESDVEALSEAADRTPGHRHDRGWRLTAPWAPIDWALAPDPGEPGHAEALERLAEVAAYGA